MSPSKHTPGPWRVHEKTAIEAMFEGEWEQVACLSRTSFCTDHKKNARLRQSRDADARLIAAAPRLLAALSNLSEWAEIYRQSHMADCDCEFCASLTQADAAIQLATKEITHGH